MSNAVQYPYAFDESRKLVFIRDIEPDTRSQHTYVCPCCGHPMMPRQGAKNAWHFAHEQGRPCSSESYIHFTAKEIIARRFNDRSLPFIISLEVNGECYLSQVCKEIQTNCRLYHKNVEYDLHEHYDLPAALEVDVLESDGITHYRPDVLFRSSNPERKDIFVEIFHKHRSTDQKIDSGHLIIEIRVRDMDALHWLETTPYISETRDIQFYGFKRELKVSPDHILEISKTIAKQSLSINEEEFMAMMDGLLEGSASKDSPPVMESGFDYKAHEEEYFYPTCKQSPQIKIQVREANRSRFHLRRLTLYRSGKNYETGIYYDELDTHHPSAMMDITYDAGVASFYAPFMPLELLAKKDSRARICSLCEYCITAGYVEENTWCVARRNGSTKKGTFNMLKGPTCDLFEFRKWSGYVSQEQPVEGIDYTIWISPNV